MQDTESVNCIRGKSLAYEKTGKWPEALTEAEKWLTLEPKNAKVKSSLYMISSYASILKGHPAFYARGEIIERYEQVGSISSAL